MKKFLKRMSIVTFICILIWLAGYYWTAANLKKVCQDWPLLNSNLADMSQVYPKITGGQSTKDLQALCNEISLSNQHNIRSQISDYLRKELEHPSAAINILPHPVQQVLLENQSIIEFITLFLVTENTLILPLDVDVNPVSPIINSATWIHNISDLLVVSALSSQLDGDLDNAWLFLEASAHLTDALFQHPSLISQVLAIRQSRHILLAMRKMTVPTPYWAQNWPDHDIENGVFMGFTADARIFLTLAEETNFSDLLNSVNEFRRDFGLERVEVGIPTQVLFTLGGRQLLRFYATKRIATIRGIIQKRSEEGLCVTLPLKDVRSNTTLPFWFPGKEIFMAIFSYDNSNFIDMYNKIWNSLYRTEVYKTGTQLILNTKAIKAGSENQQWPSEIPVLTESCPEHSWTYQYQPNGTVIFAYQKPLHEGKNFSKIVAGDIRYIGSPDN